MEAHFLSKTDTPTNEKDLWQTPLELFTAIDNEFNFDLDVCASADNHLCEAYFSERVSALDNEWHCHTRNGQVFKHKVCFINPPYSQTQLFLEKAAQQAKINNVTVVALVNANTDTKWFASAVESANEVRLFTGRIGFVKPDGKKANGNPKGQCLIVWRGNCKAPCQITMVDRNELIGE